MQATVPLDLSVSRPMLERLGDQLPVVLLKKIKQIRTYAYHQLTGEDILFKNSNISVPIGPAVFMKEANSVAKFVDDISHLTP